MTHDLLAARVEPRHGLLPRTWVKGGDDVQLEDRIGLDTPVNVPGTGDEYANWRRKLPENWERLLEREDVWELARILGNSRGS